MFGVIYCFMRLNLFIYFHSYSCIKRMTCMKTFQRNYPETNQTFFPQSKMSLLK